MSVFLGIAIYVIIWWLVLFTMLPIGARSMHEADAEAPAGVERGAPIAHRLWFKVALTTIVSAVLWVLVAWALAVDLLNLIPD